MAENESLDGATTALHRRIEELTAELAGANQALHMLRAELEDERSARWRLQAARDAQLERAEKAEADVRTARAARDQAEKQLAHTEDLLRGTADSARNWEEMCEQAGRERDTALARVKEWERAYDSSGFGPQTPDEVRVFLRERDRVNGQVAALRVSAAETALASARAQVAALTNRIIASAKALATERAVRKQAEKRSQHNHDCSVRDRNALAAAERERDTALARVKELEAAHAELTDMCKHGIDAHKAAETALASAREKLSGLMLAIEDNYGECAEDSDDLIEVDGLIDADAIYEDLKDLRDRLTSHPAPVAEPDPLPEYEPPRMTERRAIWRCTIGINEVISLPDGCDQAMRCAAWQAFVRVVGRDPVFTFSGWNTELTEEQLAVVENRMPLPPVAAPCAGCTSARTAITEALRLYAGGHEHGDVLRAWLKERP